MVNFLRASIGLAALLASSGAAHAADLSMTPIYKTRPDANSAAGWSGVYLGAGGTINTARKNRLETTAAQASDRVYPDAALVPLHQSMLGGK